jgi:hypothetical protein
MKVVVSDGLKKMFGQLTESTVEDEVRKLNEQYNGIAYVMRSGDTIYVMETLVEESDGNPGTQ